MALRLINRPQVTKFCLSRLSPTCSQPSRHTSQNSPSEDLADHVVIADNGMIVCWHPERPFPYECSRPLPEKPHEETNTVLKVQNTAEVRGVFKPKSEEMVRQELMKITSTTKHRWVPKGRELRVKEYRRKLNSMGHDREYL